MSGPSPRPHVFPKKRFQAATVAAIDQHAAAITQISEKQQAQGEYLADLAVDRDALKVRVDQLASLERVEAIASLVKDLYEIKERGVGGRLRWLLTGK